MCSGVQPVEANPADWRHVPGRGRHPPRPGRTRAGLRCRQVGVRESAQSWRDLLADVKRRGPRPCAGDRGGRRRARLLARARRDLPRHPTSAVLGGACQAPERQSRSGWQAEGHKATKVLNTVPKSVQAAIKQTARDPPRRPVFAAAVAMRGSPSTTCWPGTRITCAPRPPPDRVRLRHGPPPHGPHRGRALAQRRQADGLQARHGGRMASLGDLSRLDGDPSLEPARFDTRGVAGMPSVPFPPCRMLRHAP